MGEMPGLFACFEEGFQGDQPLWNFFKAYAVPCVPAVEISAVVDPEVTQSPMTCGIFWACCPVIAACVHGCSTTPKLLEKFGRQGDTNCLVMYCCPPCALEQQHKFIRTKFQKERWGQLSSGPVPAVRMAPPRQQMAPSEQMF